MTRTASTAILLIASAASPASADDAGSPARAKIDKATATYQAEMKTFREKGAAWFAAQETTVRATGDKKRVDKLRDEEKRFRILSELPAIAPADLRRRPSTAREKLLATYAAGVKEATKAGKDNLAAEFEKEAARIKGGVDPSLDRRHLVHPSGGFWTDGGGIWTELLGDSGRLTFREVDRTPEYVEITTTIGGRTIDVRLINTGAYFRDSASGEYNLGYRGRWWTWGQPKPTF